jgi:hypothetical protein
MNGSAHESENTGGEGEMYGVMKPQCQCGCVENIKRNKCNVKAYAENGAVGWRHRNIVAKAKAA